jgi:hypothetical protein
MLQVKMSLANTRLVRICEIGKEDLIEKFNPVHLKYPSEVRGEAANWQLVLGAPGTDTESHAHDHASERISPDVLCVSKK